LLKKKAGKKTDEFARDFSDQDIMDLQVLFNLTWIGFTGRKDPGIAEPSKRAVSSANMTRDTCSIST